ncbi:Long-chain-fatty-acid--CoA ligase (EC 6.2.1.3) [Azospirillum doebereinerae]
MAREGDGCWTYRDAKALTHRIANALVTVGLGPEAVIGTWSPNSALGLCCQYGIARAGMIWAPINVRNSASQNIEILEFLDVEFLFYHSQCAADVEQARVRLPNIKGFVCIDGRGAAGTGLDDWLAAHDRPAEYHIKGDDDVVVIPTTSGTTGRPKGVMLTNRNWEGIVANCQILMPYDVPPVHLVAAPLTHAAGYLSTSLLPLGGTLVILPNSDPLAIMEGIQEHRATTVWLPPTVMYKMLSHPRVREFDYSSLRYFIYGGQPVSPDRLREANAIFGPVLAQTYGQTEAPMAASVLLPADHAAAFADPARASLILSAGRPGPLVQIVAMADDGTILPPGQPGELVYRGSIVMKGYYKNQAATEEVSAHGWHHTGDVGYIDEDGYVFLVDRKKDMIISGGFNIYPTEIEQVVWSHPAVQDCAVIGVPDDKWGEAVTAVVELKSGATLDPQEIIAMCKERLGGVKAPKQVLVWEQLPRSPVGKILKREIRTRFWAGRDRII